MDREKEELLHQIEIRLSETRNRAKTILEELNREGVEIQKQILDSAKKQAEEMSKKAKEELENTVKKTRENLRREVETFSKKIVEKMVGV
jgi:F0F1-type ATP synthase membrane subunit b/b'